MKDRIVKFIDVYIPCTVCPFACSYCYVRQRPESKRDIPPLTDAKTIRRAFARERLGGCALINLCAAGETLLHPDLPDVIRELVREGHYVSIVTNGILTDAFERIIQTGISMEYLFFKFSFHYLELLRTNTLQTYIQNVNKMRKVGASYTIELVASDDQVPYIEEIKKVCTEAFGALPHVTIPRDDRTEGIDLMTSYSMEEYKRIWESFDSELFRYKMHILYKKQTENCMAGDWSYIADLLTGDIRQCLGHKVIGNLYENMDKPFPEEKVGYACRLPYCYNGHVFYSMGDVVSFPAPFYYEVRDRVTSTGEHWITDTMKDIFTQKLYENNTGDV